VSGVVLVTGAGGFIGRHVCRRLLEDGWTVRGGVRSSEPPPGVQPVQLGEAAAGPALREAVRGCAAVVHLAGRAHVMRETEGDPLAAFRRVNVDLTRALAAAAVAEGASDFVLMSSIAAVSGVGSEHVSDADVTAPGTDYGLSKLESEDALEEQARGGSLRAVALRPPMVYGEHMRGNPLRLYRHLLRGRPLPVLRPPVRRSMMYAGNLAEAVAASLGDATLHGRFCVTDGAAVPIEEFARASAAALGRTARLVPLPARAVHAAAAVGSLLLRATGGSAGAVALARLTQSLYVDDARFRSASGFAPPYGFEDGIARTAAWFLDGATHRRNPRYTAQGTG
jgi:nucleoside-diphosphate-sugar epimerase